MNALPPRLVRDRPRRENRLRCPAHLKFVRSHACCVPGCLGLGLLPIEAAHVRVGTDGSTGMKPGDNWTISLCGGHHADQHRIGERSFERQHGIDMKALAQAFWAAFRKINPAAVRRAEQRMER